jgi:hypothetical protein
MHNLHSSLPPPCSCLYFPLSPPHAVIEFSNANIAAPGLRLIGGAAPCSLLDISVFTTVTNKIVRGV